MVSIKPKHILDKLIKRYPELDCCRKSIQMCYEAIFTCFDANGKMLICGNGGSASDADHMAGELIKGFHLKRPLDQDLKNKILNISGSEASFIDRLQGSLPVISLPAQSSLISAINNDQGGDLVYAQQIIGLGNPGDCLFAISTSGNSLNVLNAVVVARAKEMMTIALSGKTGGQLASKCDFSILAPSREVDEIQEYHLPIYHTICSMLEARFFG